MSNEVPRHMAKLFASKVLRTNVLHRPYPSIFYFPGLKSQPFHKIADFPSLNNFDEHFKQNLELIQAEYLSLRKAYLEAGNRDDYIKIENEKTLNEGNWHWMNYIEKGKRRSDVDALFRDHCPVTTHLLEESIG